MKEEWLMPGAVVPVDANTTGALIAEIKRLIGVVGGMALNQQRTWVGLTDAEVIKTFNAICNGKPFDVERILELHRAIEAKLRGENT